MPRWPPSGTAMVAPIRRLVEHTPGLLPGLRPGPRHSRHLTDRPQVSADFKPVLRAPHRHAEDYVLALVDAQYAQVSEGALTGPCAQVLVLFDRLLRLVSGGLRACGVGDGAGNLREVGGSGRGARTARTISTFFPANRPCHDLCPSTSDDAFRPAVEKTTSTAVSAVACIESASAIRLRRGSGDDWVDWLTARRPCPQGGRASRVQEIIDAFLDVITLLMPVDCCPSPGRCRRTFARSIRRPPRRRHGLRTATHPDRQRVLGDSHPDTLVTCGDLADWRGKAGYRAGAVLGYERLLTDIQRVLGSYNPDALAVQSNLVYWREQPDPDR
jgi:hypothetical protein